MSIANVDEQDEREPLLKSWSQQRGDIVSRADRAAVARMRAPADRRTGLHALKLAQERQRIRDGKSDAIEAALRASGLLTGAEGQAELDPSGAAGTVTWYAVQCVPGMERRARDELLRLGHLARVPMKVEWERQRQRQKWRRAGKIRVERVLCGGYAFLGVRGASADWRTIRRCDGVVGVLGAEGRPQRVADAGALFALFVADQSGTFDQTLAVKPGLRGPAAFRIIEGAYAGFIARILACKGDAARVVIKGLFGRGVVDVPKDVLEAV